MWRTLALLAVGCATSSRPPLPPGERLDELESACPASRTDAVCSCLRNLSPACFPGLVQSVRERLGTPDPALAYFLRQRLVSLLVQKNADVDGALKEYFPAYPA